MSLVPSFPLNTSIRFAASCYNVSGSLTDPTTVLFEASGSDGVSYTKTAVRDGVGLYHYDFTTATPAGQWYYRFQATGALIVQSPDTPFAVQFPKF